MTYALGLARGEVELKSFYRERDQLVFTFALPVVLLVLLGTVFDGVYDGTTVTSAHYMVPSMIAAGIASATFLSLGTSIAADRENGTLKRLRGLPMPMSAYVVGKVAVVLVVAIVQMALMLAIGVLLFDLPLPSDPGRWFTFAWVVLLGTIACSLLGVAASQVALTAASAATAMNMLHLVLAFLSGIYFTPISTLPSALVTIGSFFPLKWMGQGLRSALLPDSILSVEVTGSWEHGRTALVLAAWCVGGALLCLLALRRRARRDG